MPRSKSSSLSIKRALLILIAAPILGLLIMGLTLGVQTYSRAQLAKKDEQNVRAISSVTIDLMLLIDELQKERALAVDIAYTISAEEEPNFEDYKRQWIATDKRRNALSETIVKLRSIDSDIARDAIPAIEEWLADGPTFSCSGNGTQAPTTLVEERHITTNPPQLDAVQVAALNATATKLPKTGARRTPQALRYYRRQIEHLYSVAESLTEIIVAPEMSNMMQGYLYLSRSIEELSKLNTLAINLLKRGSFMYMEPIEYTYTTALRPRFVKEFENRCPTDLYSSFDFGFSEEKLAIFERSAHEAKNRVYNNEYQMEYDLAAWNQRTQPIMQGYRNVLAQYGEGALAKASASSSSGMQRFYLMVGMIIGITVISYIFSKFIGVLVSRRLRSVVAELASSSENVEDASGTTTSVSHELSSDASRFAASMEEVSSTLEEISSMVDNSNASAAQVQTISQLAETAVQNNLSSVQSLEQNMSELDESSDKIASIIKTIEEIAFQTNILALNAAVEAARAGEAGSGFAVVADEVRALAQRSAKAANETGSIISSSTELTKHGGKITAEVVKRFQEMSEQVAQISSAGDSIAQSVQQQTDGIHQINSAIHQNSNMAQDLASAATKMIDSSQSMTSEVKNLNKNVDALENFLGEKA